MTMVWKRYCCKIMLVIFYISIKIKVFQCIAKLTYMISKFCSIFHVSLIILLVDIV